MQRGDFDRALTVAEFDVSLDPHSPLNRRDRGLAHYMLGHAAKALRRPEILPGARPGRPRRR